MARRRRNVNPDDGLFEGVPLRPDPAAEPPPPLFPEAPPPEPVEPPFDLAGGQELQGEAKARFEDTRPGLLLAARRLLLMHLIEHGVGSIDNVRDKLKIPAGINPKCMGGVAMPFKKLNIVVVYKYDHSERKIAHARKVEHFRLIDAAAAHRWLRENPAKGTAA